MHTNSGVSPIKYCAALFLSKKVLYWRHLKSTVLCQGRDARNLSNTSTLHYKSCSVFFQWTWKFSSKLFYSFQEVSLTLVLDQLLHLKVRLNYRMHKNHRHLHWHICKHASHGNNFNLKQYLVHWSTTASQTLIWLLLSSSLGLKHKIAV